MNKRLLLITTIIAGLCAHFSAAMAMNEQEYPKFERAKKLMIMAKSIDEESEQNTFFSNCCNENDIKKEENKAPEKITGIERDIIGKCKKELDKYRKQKNTTLKISCNLGKVNISDIINNINSSNFELSFQMSQQGTQNISLAAEQFQQLVVAALTVIENPIIKKFNLANSALWTTLIVCIITMVAVMVISIGLIFSQISVHNMWLTSTLYRICNLAGIKIIKNKEQETAIGKLLTTIKSYEQYVKDSSLNVFNYGIVIAAMIIFAEMNVAFFLTLFGAIVTFICIKLLIKNHNYRYARNIDFDPKYYKDKHVYKIQEKNDTDEC